MFFVSVESAVISLLVNSLDATVVGSFVSVAFKEVIDKKGISYQESVKIGTRNSKI